MSDGRPSGQPVDARIKKLARRLLCAMAPDRDRLVDFRDYCRELSDYFAELADYIDRELKTKRRTNPKWKRDRPTASDIRAQEQQLKSIIGHDVEKLELMEKLVSQISSLASDPFNFPSELERTSDSLDGRTIMDALRVFTRGTPGRHKKNERERVIVEVYRLHLEGKSYGQLAHRFYPAIYKNDPARATSRIKTAIHRYKTTLEQRR
jgi:chromatin segregation and condensation protein Rec8/ScpA/Scc1 (kleisin family)